MTRVRIGDLVPLATFVSGWLMCSTLFLNPVLQQQQQQQQQQHQRIGPPESTPERRTEIGRILGRRPNWRKDYDLLDWLPQWVSPVVIEDWKASLQDPERPAYYTTLPSTLQEEQKRDHYFWNTIVTSGSTQKFTFANANIGLGHRLAQLSYSYTCQVTPHRQQQLIHWVTGGLDDNRGWHHLFQDSPVLAGVPPYWLKGESSVDRFREYRTEHNMSVAACGDYNTMYPLDCRQGGAMCRGFKHPRDLWLLRFAKEPSAQEFYQLLRAQIRPAIKEKLANFMDEFWPRNKLVVAVHIRAGNGKDDGLGHFDLVNRGDWL